MLFLNQFLKYKVKRNKMIDTSISLEMLNNSGCNNMQGYLGIEYVEVTKDYLKAKMPVDYRTHQQLGMLHGGASATLAEMTGSMAAYLSIDRDDYYCVGLEIKVNHLKSVREGFVFARASPLHKGSQTQVWQIKTYDENDELIANSILTMAILPLDEKMRSMIGDIFRKTET